MTAVDIPDFAAMPDDELHRWEFEVYDLVPGSSELREIIGTEKAREYYQERGKRLDTNMLAVLNEREASLVATRLAVSARLRTGKSAQHYFASQIGEWL